MLFDNKINGFMFNNILEVCDEKFSTLCLLILSDDWHLLCLRSCAISRIY